MINIAIVPYSLLIAWNGFIAILLMILIEESEQKIWLVILYKYTGVVNATLCLGLLFLITPINTSGIPMTDRVIVVSVLWAGFIMMVGFMYTPLKADEKIKHIRTINDNKG